MSGPNKQKPMESIATADVGDLVRFGMVPFLLKMQEYGFGSDQLEVMVGGNPDHRIRPGALKAALADFYTAALDSILSEKSPDNG